jgi:hypothetical protein
LRPSGQYYLLFGPSGNIIFYFAPWLCPSVDTVFYSTQRQSHSGKIFFYLAPQMHLSRQNSTCNPLGFFVSGFLQAALAPIPTWFFKASIQWHFCCFSCNAMQQTAFCILSDAHSRLLFIGVGVAFVATLWTNHHLHPSNAYSHSIDTFLSGDAS